MGLLKSLISRDCFFMQRIGLFDAEIYTVKSLFISI